MRVAVAGTGVLYEAITHLLGVVCTSTARHPRSLDALSAAWREADRPPESIVLVADPAFSDADAAAWLTTLRSARLWEGHLVVVCASRKQQESLRRLRVGNDPVGRTLDSLPGHAIIGSPIRLVELLAAAAGSGLQAEFWMAACCSPGVLGREQKKMRRLLKKAQLGVWTSRERLALEAARAELTEKTGLFDLFPGSHADQVEASQLLEEPVKAELASDAAALLSRLTALLDRSPWRVPEVGTRMPRRSRPVA